MERRKGAVIRSEFGALERFNQSRINVPGGPEPARLIWSPWGGVLGVGAIVLCTSESGNAQLGPNHGRRQGFEGGEQFRERSERKQNFRTPPCILGGHETEHSTVFNFIIAIMTSERIGIPAANEIT